jgi:2,4-dienoyl-CoA reductase-like NADH-dependent reductase (Old Yellow Enzyme family)
MIAALDDSFPALSSPFTLRGSTIRNRLAHASMTTRMQRGGYVTDELIRYYANRAAGGAGLIVSEPLAMIAQQDRLPKVRVRDPAGHDGLRRWADAVAEQGGVLLGQVQDPGRGRHAPGRAPYAISASFLPDDLSWTMPDALDQSAIMRLVEEFAQSCAILETSGFGGCEISAGHGHLFHQFLSPRSNQRDDGYGGDLEGRTRLLRELIGAIRAACGPGFIIGLKLPGDDGVTGSIDPDQAAQITRIIAKEAPPDYLCFAQGSHAHSLERHLPDRYGPAMPYRDLQAQLRKACGTIPMMALGRITDPAEAEALVAAKEAELVGVGRALVADPAWLAKARAGRTHDIRYCLSCNTCWAVVTSRNQALACVNNPRVGAPDEVDYRPVRLSSGKRVTIVGAGPAGLEAAWVAAARGHEVTVLSAGSAAGGGTRLRALLPGGETITSIPDYQYPAALRAGVRFEFGIMATPEDVLATRPDAVVLATGAAMVAPAWLPAEIRDENLVPSLPEALWDLTTRTDRQPGTAIIYDMDHTDGVYAAAEFLHARFDKVVLVTPRDGVAEDMWLVARQGIIRRLYEKHISVMRSSEPVWTQDFEQNAALACINLYNGEHSLIGDVAFLAYATPRAPRVSLLEPLRRQGIPVHRIGDCRVALDLLNATSDGHEMGHSL